MKITDPRHYASRTSRRRRRRLPRSQHRRHPTSSASTRRPMSRIAASRRTSFTTRATAASSTGSTPPRGSASSCRATLLTDDRGRRARADREEHQGHAAPRAVTWIPSSAPPPAPKVLYVVPTFGWAREVDEHGTLSSWRRGGGLARLSRPRVERLGLRRDARGRAAAAGLCRRSRTPTPAGAPVQEIRDAVGQRSDLGLARSCPASRRRSAHFPLARTAPDPTGAWLPPDAPADEKRSAAGPFPVSGLPPVPSDAACGAGRRRAARRVLRSRPAALVLRHRDRPRRGVLSVHPPGAGALSADLGRRRASVECRAGATSSR